MASSTTIDQSFQQSLIIFPPDVIKRASVSWDIGEIQLALLCSYGPHPALYLPWQKYFRQYQPPTLIVWGKNGTIFSADGAYPYQRDLKEVDFHLLDTGHFALEEDGNAIANHIAQFLASRLQPIPA
jgi:pimeloyl-ACP methyl ester carboxylesterase